MTQGILTAAPCSYLSALIFSKYHNLEGLDEKPLLSYRKENHHELVIPLVLSAALVTRWPSGVGILFAAAFKSAGGDRSIDLKNYAKPFCVSYGDMMVLPSSSRFLVA